MRRDSGKRENTGQTTRPSDVPAEKMRRWPRTGDPEIRRWKREQVCFVPTEPPRESKAKETITPAKSTKRQQQYVAHPDLYLPEALRNRPNTRKVVLTFLMPHLVFCAMLLATLLPLIAASTQVMLMRLAVIALVILAAALGHLSLRKAQTPALLDRLGSHGAMNAACLAVAGTVVLLTWGPDLRRVPNLVALLASLVLLGCAWDFAVSLWDARRALRSLPHRSRLPLSWMLALAAAGVVGAGAAVVVGIWLAAMVLAAGIFIVALLVIVGGAGAVFSAGGSGAGDYEEGYRRGLIEGQGEPWR